MSAATPGHAAREAAEAPFRVWMYEVGHDPDDMRTYYGVGALAEAFQGGTQAAPELAAYEADIASLTDQRNRVSETADQLRVQVRNLRDALERCRDAAGRSPAAVHTIASQALASSPGGDQ